MKYCSHCGAELNDEATVCIKCGCATDTKQKETANNTGLRTAAKIFMILSCIAMPFAVLEFGVFFDTLFGIILTMCIPLTWCIPMTVYYWKKCDSVGIGFKICTLIFVNAIAGILMLCDKTN